MVVLRVSSNELFPEDVYPATLAGVQEETSANGLYLKWLFQVEGGALVPGFTGTSAAPQAKARKWIEALAGRALKDGETIDLEEIYGNHCRAYVSVVNGRNGQMNRVERVLSPAQERGGPLQSEGNIRRVCDRGICIEGHWYYHPMLSSLVGKDVFVRPDRLGDPTIYVYTLENWYICSIGCKSEPTGA